MRRLVALGLGLAACAGSASSTQSQKPAPTVTAPMAATAASTEPEPDAVPELSAPGSRFAQTPITRLAEQVIQVAQAAIQSQPLPAVDFPIERHQPDDRLVRSDEPIPRELEFLVFGMELEIALAPGRVVSGEEVSDGLELALFLSQHGLKLISLEPEGVGRPKPAPSWLSLNPLADEIVADLRANRMQRWWIGEAERALIGPELTRELDEQLPKPEEIERAKQSVKNATRVQGFEIDDVGLLARDSRGRFWSFELQFESGDVPELDAHPLVRVKRLGRDER